MPTSNHFVFLRVAKYYLCTYKTMYLGKVKLNKLNTESGLVIMKKMVFSLMHL